MNSRILIYAPRGRDAHVANDLLSRAGLSTAICADPAALLDALSAGAGLLLMTEEALAQGLPDVVDWLKAQETWSDMPIIVLANGSRSPRTAAAADRLSDLGNVVMLERPLHAEALTGAVRSALKARARQFEARDAADRLRESEARLNLAVDNAEVGFWDVDIVNDRMIWPARTKAMFGITADVPVTLQDFYDGLHPDDRARTIEAFEAASDPAVRALYDVEYRTIGRDDGTVRWVAAKGRGVFDEDGLCTRVAGTVLEITPRKAVEARRELLAELAQALKDLDDPVAISGVAARLIGRFLGVARAGYGAINPVDETLHVISDWTAPGIETLTGVLSLRDYGTFIDSLKRGEFTVIEDVRLDARTAPAAAALESRGARAFVNAPILEQGRLVAIFFLNHADVRSWHEADLALVREFAERTRTAVERASGALALRESEMRLRELNESLEQQVQARLAERDRLWNLSQDMLARADFSGMMSAVSPAWRRVLGWSEQDLLSRGYASFMHPDDAPSTLAAIGRMAETHEPARFENRIATRDGDWKPIEWTVAPEPDGVNFIAVGRDLSHVKAREGRTTDTDVTVR